MSEVRTVKCDVCGRQKQETNHWLVAIIRTDAEGIIFQPAECTEEPRNTIDFAYDDICGRGCATQRLNQWIESVTPTAAERQTA